MDFRVTEISIDGVVCPPAHPFVFFNEPCPEDTGSDLAGSTRLGGGDWEWSDEEKKVRKVKVRAKGIGKHQRFAEICVSTRRYN